MNKFSQNMSNSSPEFSDKGNSGKIGFHYYPDTYHYRDGDLQTWLPELLSLGASWLVLKSDIERAIPENFIRSLVENGIQPIIQFNLSLANTPDIEEIHPLVESYKRWGCKYVLFFDRPNSRTSWPASGWAQQDLVERFIDRFLPFAGLALANDLIPIFPALEPGGSFWDTAFLRSALQSLDRRKQADLLDKMVLAAYAWSQGHSLDWGAGGPERWAEAKPYFTPPDVQDQRGFRCFEWYQAIAKSVLKRPLPLFLLGAGAEKDPTQSQDISVDPARHAETNKSILDLLSSKQVVDPKNPDNGLESLAEEIIGCNFWLLASDAADSSHPQAWYQDQQNTLPIVNLLKEEKPLAKHPHADFPSTASKSPRDNIHAIQHYLLLPTYEWGVADWHLDVIRGFVKKHQPTIGFSLSEANMAARVTVIGNSQTFSDESLDQLRQAGCAVERISGDGTSIATQLNQR
ncbi:MAG: hypothetical protein AB9891_15535 [Anaerolineaceae bacterium]